MTATQYQFTITGTRPLLLHHDNIEFADRLSEDRKNKAKMVDSKAGDDRSPAWSWIGSLYHDGNVVGLSHAMIETCLRDAGSKITAEKMATFKRIVASGFMVDDAVIPLQTPSGTIQIKDVNSMLDVSGFSQHKEFAEDHGFTLDIRRAKVGQSKHVRVRPKFWPWSATGTLTVTDPRLTKEKLEELFEIAGRLHGIGDWRPSSPKSPGQYGKFTAEIQAA